MTAMQPPPSLDRIDRSGFEEYVRSYYLERFPNQESVRIDFSWHDDRVSLVVFDPETGFHRKAPCPFRVIPRQFVTPIGY